MKIRPTLATLCTLLLLSLALGTLNSCDKKERVKSLSEMLRDEEKLISAFIQEQQISVEDGVEGQKEFAPDVWYKFPNGVYLNVLNAGGDHAVPKQTRVMMRIKGRFLGSKLTTPFDNLSKGIYQPTEFIYVDSRDMNIGAIHYLLPESDLGINLNDLMCEGLAYPLTMVGDGAQVRLIVPFLKGANVAYSSGAPMYCEDVRYEFVKE